MEKLLRNEELCKRVDTHSYSELQSFIKEKYNLTPKCILITRSSDNDFHLNERQDEAYEIIYMEEGKIAYSVNNNTYIIESGDFLLVPPNTPHKLLKIISSPNKRSILKFDNLYLNKFNTESTDLSLIFEKVTNTNTHQIKIRTAFKNRINSSFSMLEEVFLSKEYGDDIIFDATFSALLARMNKGLNFYDANNYINNFGALILKVNNYIDINIDKKMLIQDIASHVGLSESRLSHIYKQQLGISILQHVINKRLSIAKDMLKIGESISEVAVKCGFPDYSSFLRAFKKKYNISPKAYQKQYFTQQ